MGLDQGRDILRRARDRAPQAMLTLLTQKCAARTTDKRQLL
jgi:hypothetical protein